MARLRPEFEKHLRTGVQLVLRSGLQSVHANLWSKMVGLIMDPLTKAVRLEFEKSLRTEVKVVLRSGL